MKYFVLTLLTVLSVISLKAQIPDTTSFNSRYLDSLYIQEVEERLEPVKVLHAEPLYIDLIRDLGARKGEKEWNVGAGLTDKNRYDSYLALVEYEWAPINRLGLEIELPFTFYYPIANGNDTPGSRLNSLKLAAQWSFLVSDKLKTTLALGHIQEFEFTEFANYGRSRFLTGHVYNPFFIAAKRWGQNWHTLVYTGPVFEQHLRDNSWHTTMQVNTNLHYMIPGTRNFVGVEFNKEIRKNDFDMIIRPQMRVAITEHLLVGIVTGIPIERENERFSSFLRLIYEPPHKPNKRHKHIGTH